MLNEAKRPGYQINLLSFFFFFFFFFFFDNAQVINLTIYPIASKTLKTNMEGIKLRLISYKQYANVFRDLSNFTSELS
jgi:hypothetical protein